jgi:hypothetical protein
MESQQKVISREEVTQNLLGGLLQDQQEFKASVGLLKHGQKNRLLEAMCEYPIQDITFDESEPELRVAMATWKRISDSLVALGTEAAIEGILNSIQQPKQEGDVNESAEKKEE